MVIHLIGKTLRANPGAIIVANSVGVEKFTVEADGSWQGLTKTVYFRSGDIVKEVLCTASEQNIPPEVLNKGPLWISAVGRANGIQKNTAKQTVSVMVMESGDTDGEDPDSYTPALWEQALAAIGDLSELETEEKQSLVKAINEAISRGGGGSTGATFTPSISEEGTISWTNDKGLENPHPVNVKGDEGGHYIPEISQPNPGQMQVIYTCSKAGMPSVSPTTIQLPAGEDGPEGGYYRLSITQPEAGKMKISFTASKVGMPAIDPVTVDLPPGKDGDAGKTPALKIGTVTTLAAGSQAAATITGTAENPVLNLSIPMGPQGPAGADGKSAYQSYVDSGGTLTETQWLASLAQGAPEYAVSTEECTDTSKMYVLPDGFIYAYITKTETKTPVNWLPISTDSNGAVFNGTGYKTNYQLYAADGSERAKDGYECSGFIPYKATDTVRIKNYGWATPATAYDNICFYDANFAFVGVFTNSSTANPLSQFVQSDGTVEMCIATAGKTNFTTAKKDNIAYMRLSFSNIGSTTMVTVNEPFEYQETTTTEWRNTGHAFVPADYEGEILDLQNRVSDLESKGTADSVESYVKDEAERVAKKVYSHQNGDTFTFLVISDAHYLATDNNIVKSIVHAGQGMDLVRKNVNVDFAVCLGDNGWGSGVEGSATRATIEMGVNEICATNKCIESAFRGIQNFRLPGNHCSLIYNFTFNNNDHLDSSELFPLYGAYNRGAVFHSGEKSRGYCYRDFEDWKLRVICVNTSDIQDLTPADNTKPIYISGTQGKWFAEKLDMSDKADAADWSILILSHAPLDWGTGCIYMCDILQAYKNGTSGSVVRDGVTISYNYAGKNAATIIGNCHGHNHNFQVDNLRIYNGDSTTSEIDIVRFGMPNACFERTNEKGENDTTEVWDIEYGEPTSYEKVANTAKDTSFCVVTVDPVARKIYADCYGAGYDRQISY